MLPLLLLACSSLSGDGSSALAKGAPSAPPAAPSACGEETALPGFLLPDVNPGSATFGATRGFEEFLGRVVVIYFAQAT